MKLTAVLLLTACLQVAARAGGQTVTLKVKDMPMKEVFREIQKQTGLNILLNENILAKAGKVRLKVYNMPVQEVLNLCFRNEQISYTIVDNTIVVKRKPFPLVSIQPSATIPPTIQGKVTDESGNPMQDVTVRNQQTGKAITTDTEGKFSIEADVNDILEFSFVGYKPQRVKVASQQNIHIVMDLDIANLSDMVVIGYGTRKKVNLTGAVSTISGKEIQKLPVSNITNSLAGKVSGLIVNTRSGEPGNDNADIFIRGKGTLGNTTPLVVIDGIPDRAGGFSRLNAADIESITILKDATAAIYGARSANGVILITTRRGLAGKPALNFSANIAATQPTRVPQMLSSYQYAVATNEYDALLGQTKTWSDNDIQMFKDGSDLLSHPNTDWWNSTMKKWTLQKNYLVSLRGGTEKLKYFLSGQYEKQDGNYKKNAAYYRQAQARANVDIAASDNLKIGLDVLYRNEFRNSGVQGYDAEGIFNELWLAYPYLVDIYPNGYLGVGIGGGPGSMIQVTSNDMGYQKRTTDYLQTKVSFNWNLSRIIRGFFVDGYYSYDLSFFRYKAFNKTPPPAYMYDSNTGEYTQIVALNPPSLYEQRDNTKDKLLNIRLGFARTFHDHSLETFVAYEQYQGDYDNIAAYRKNFLSNSIDQLFAGGQEGKDNNSSARQSARVNFISRISYTYNDKYFIDYNMRYDGSQSFPDGNNFGFFPGVSAAWRVSGEKFFNLSWLNELKLRASWGKTGNDVVLPFQYIQTYQFGPGYFFGSNASLFPSFVLGPAPNPNITWEVSKTTNIGIETQFLKGGLGVSLDFFRSMRSKILIQRNEAVPLYTGLRLPAENLGKVLNKGFEFEFYYYKAAGKSFSYNINGNFTFARNRVVYMDEIPNVPDYQKKTGYPIDSWFIYRSDRVFQNNDDLNKYPHPLGTGVGDIKYLDLNGDNNITAEDRERISLTRMPEILYGTTFSAKYKTIDLSIFFQGQARAKAILRPSGLNMAEEFFNDRWQKEGDNKYPRNFNGPTGRTFGVNSYDSDFWLRDNSFLRLKNVELGYNLGKRILRKAWIQASRVYINGNNLFSVDKFGPSFDPESPNDIGRYYPQQRVINIGATITF